MTVEISSTEVALTSRVSIEDEGVDGITLWRAKGARGTDFDRVTLTNAGADALLAYLLKRKGITLSA